MTSKIDTLRQKVAEIGKTQAQYPRFFRHFATQLVQNLGKFLGDPTCVALCPTDGDFSFDIDYEYKGLGFEKGRYRVPLMIRLKNLNDEGELLVRIKLYFNFVQNEKTLLAWVGDEKPVTVDPAQLDSLLEVIYTHLNSLFSYSTWFEENSGDYQGTHMGFALPKVQHHPSSIASP